MKFDALILSGGRGRRLGGISKAGLRKNGRTLLDIALSSAADARTTIVVGEGHIRAGSLLVRETPPYAGPVAAIDEGLRSLDPDPLAYVLVLAVDLPNASDAITVLRSWMAEHESLPDGVIAVDSDGRDQFLLGFYSVSALTHRLSTMTIEHASMKSLVSELRLQRVMVPSGSTDDIDTWPDAARLGVTWEDSEDD